MKTNTAAAPACTIALEWIRVDRYCDLTGEPRETVESRIRDATWAAGKHYKRTGPRTLWINLLEANKWVTNHQHVEATDFPKASKSGRGHAVSASA